MLHYSFGRAVIFLSLQFFFAPVLDLMHSRKPEVRGIAIRALSLVSRFLSVNKLHHLSAKDVFFISVIDNEKIIGLNCWDKLALWPKC